MTAPDTLQAPSASFATSSVAAGAKTVPGVQPGELLRHVHRVMGTVVSFEVRGGDPGAIRVAISRACARLDRANAVFSTWKPTSPISLIRRDEMTLDQAPPEVRRVLELCRLAREASGGCFDAFAMPGGLDPTGLVKGWAADEALSLLSRVGVRAAMVNAGGDVATFGEPEPGMPWRIGVCDPWSTDRIACVVASPGAVATSGCYERGNHVVDPRTGRFETNCQSATVSGPQLWLADALATGLLVAGEEGLSQIEATPGYEGYVISKTGSTATTSAFPFAE